MKDQIIGRVQELAEKGGTGNTIFSHGGPASLCGETRNNHPIFIFSPSNALNTLTPPAIFTFGSGIFSSGAGGRGI